MEIFLAIAVLVAIGLAIWLARMRPDSVEEVTEMQHAEVPRREEGAGATDARTDAWTGSPGEATGGASPGVMPEFLDDREQPNRSEPATGVTGTPGQVGMASVAMRTEAVTMYGSNSRRYEEHESRMHLVPVAAGTMAALATVAGGAYWYQRWTRERNRPLRLARQRARTIVHDVEKRLPRVQNPAPYGGAGLGFLAASAMGGFILSRIRRHTEGGEVRPALHRSGATGLDGVGGLARGLWDSMRHVELGHVRPEEVRARSTGLLRSAGHRIEKQKPTMESAMRHAEQMDAGRAVRVFAGPILLGGSLVGYITWRAMRRSNSDPAYEDTWQMGGREGSGHPAV